MRTGIERFVRSLLASVLEGLAVVPTSTRGIHVDEGIHYVYESPPVSLTDRERAVLHAIAKSEYQSGDLVGNYIWSSGVAVDAGISKRSIAGVFSSLRKRASSTPKSTAALTATPSP